MRVGIVARLDITRSLEMVPRVINLLKGEEVLLEPGLARKLGKKPGTTQALRSCDAVVTLGGDGTVLYAQRLAPHVPILGINLGGRGFLADVSPGEITHALKALTAGALHVVERDRLTAAVGDKTLPDALNELVVFSKLTGKTVALRVSIDGELAMEMRADGLIVATPTGSTAYAQSAGGSLVDPRLKALIIVPIAPSRPEPSPLVVPVYSRIAVEPTRPGRDALLIIDGRPEGNLEYGEKVMITRSNDPARFFELDRFYRKVREKL